ncbi:hypothetical protein PRIC1_003613 [Phytophthora ramorum]
MKDLPFSLGVMPNTMAVHSAAIVGYEDIVRTILEADNMIGLNTPTFHTKETLAHLAVEHGHRKVYGMLVAFGADLRIKDGSGKRVCDVTTDREWKRKTDASIADIERSQAACEGARNRDGLFRHQSDVRAEWLRQSVAAQRDQARSGKHQPEQFVGLYEEEEQEEGQQRQEGQCQGIFVQLEWAVAEGDSVEVSNLLTDVLTATGLETSGATDDSERASQLKNSVENTAAVFARLRDPSIPADEKADDVQTDRETGGIGGVLLPSLSRPNSTDRRIRNAIASEALQVLHIMQKCHRVGHAAIAVPALASVRDLCGTTPTFTRFVIGTAQLSESVGRKPQAREIMDVLEKRLLKTPVDQRGPFAFRELVETYSAARDAMDLGQTSALRNLGNTG